MSDHPNTEATPSEAEIEAAADALLEGYIAREWDGDHYVTEAATAALNAAYAIRLPPLYAELGQAERRDLLNPMATEYVERLEARVEGLERRLLLVCVSAHRVGETCDLCATPTAGATDG